MIEGDIILVEAPRFSSIAKLEIKVEPSPEHIPDEYEHINNTNGKIYIFYDGNPNDFENIKQLAETLKLLNYSIPDEQSFNYSKKEDVEEKLKKIAGDDHSKTTCLIIVFYGMVKRSDQFLFEDEGSFITTNEIWQYFTADKCEMLKNKPKLFFFQARKKKEVVQTDAHTFQIADAYDIPAEADILIVFKIIEENNLFLKKFCEQLNDFGKRDDIITLITCTDNENHRPLIISTLTRKFYVTISDKKIRGYHHELQEQNKSINDFINKMQANLNELKLSIDNNRGSTVSRSSSFRMTRKPSVKSIKSDSIIYKNKLSQVEEKANKVAGSNAINIVKRDNIESDSKSNKRNTFHGTTITESTIKQTIPSRHSETFDSSAGKTPSTSSTKKLSCSTSTYTEKKQRKYSTSSTSSRQKKERPPWK